MILGAAHVFNFAGYPLLDPDEGRNAEVMREMAASNQYVVPHLNALPYVDKPVLVFAAGALAMELFGPTEFAARLPSLLFTLATLALIAWFGGRLWSREAGWIAALAVAATPLTMAYSRIVIFDAAVTFWIVSALVGFYLAAEAAKTAEAAAWWRLAAWGALGLGVLTKGPVALAVPLTVAVPYAAWRQRLRALVDPASILLFAALVLPWTLAMSARVPEYFGYVLGTETLGRLTTTELGRGEAWWYFLIILPAAALPWSAIVMWRALRAHRIRGLDHRAVLLALWIIVPLAFFTLSQSKRPQYVLPLVPAFGLAVAGLWTREERPPTGERRVAAGTLGIIGALLIGAARAIPDWVSTTPEIAAAIPATAVGLGAVCVAAGVVVFAARRRHIAVLALALPVAAIPFVSVRLMDAIGTYRSAAPLAQALERRVSNATQIVAVETFPPSLPFYRRRPVTLATTDARELTSNYLVRHYNHWTREPGTPLRPASWWRDVLLTCPRATVFIVAVDDRPARRLLDQHLDLIADTGKHAAYGPCGRTNLASSHASARNRLKPADPVVTRPRPPRSVPPCCGPPFCGPPAAARGCGAAGR